MDCDYHDDQQSATSAGRTPRRLAERSCQLSWRHCRSTNKPDAHGDGDGGSVAAIRFNLIFVEKCCHRGGAAEFEFPVETKSFCWQAYEFLTPLTAARAVGEMLAEVCLDDESREQFREAIVEYVQAEKVAERTVVGKVRSLTVVKAAMEVVTIVYNDDDSSDDDDDDDYEKENKTVSTSVSEEQK